MFRIFWMIVEIDFGFFKLKKWKSKKGNFKGFEIVWELGFYSVV